MPAERRKCVGGAELETAGDLHRIPVVADLVVIDDDFRQQQSGKDADAERQNGEERKRAYLV